ncbi:MAG: YopX family protein [Helicobacter sp.]|uniref:YopX family protein n=1 Tax=Helicobacter sp. TaxID=218 RepID=UPI002A917633|nr:YopX family protein [Helicobacter sp.]MDY5949869.1 YopX family protein [Helicobacter sp.]
MKLKDFDFRLWSAMDNIYLYNPSLTITHFKSAVYENAYSMEVGEVIDENKDEREVLIGCLDNNRYKSIEIELWSGFYDCKRVKIYENDIVSCNNATYQVVYERGVFWVKNNKHNLIMAQAIHYEPLEVIGNIHENADLLEEEKVFIKKCKYADIECLCGK